MTRPRNSLYWRWLGQGSFPFSAFTFTHYKSCAGSPEQSIQASVIAAGLDVEPAQLLIVIRSGEITSISEQGVVEDAGFHRLTFYYRNRRFRLIVDAAGQIVRRSSVNFGQQGRPPGSEGQ